jgi:hypothetical protein
MHLHPFCILLVKFRQISGVVSKTKDALTTPRFANDNEKIVRISREFEGQITNLHPVHLMRL